MLDEKILTELREMLELEKTQLVSELKSIARPDKLVKGEWKVQFPTFERSENISHAQKEEEADEVEEYEMRLAAEDSLESRLLEVNHALERIETSQYGICKKCRKPMGLDRLRANPAADCHAEHIE